MPHRSHRTRVLAAAAVACALAAAGCAAGGPTGDVDKLKVETSQFELSVTNTSGRALFDVKVEILPTGPSSHYTAIVPRMENGERRSLSHNLFTDNDHVSFSARNTRAKGIMVTAKDIDGKELRLEMPWSK